MALLVLFLLLSLFALHVDGGIECSAGKDSCQDCYAKLVSQITDRDENQFNLQKAFFPPDKSSPVFVTVHYRFVDSCNSFGTDDDAMQMSNDTKVWFWSETIFYLMQPIHVLQFTSLLFSNTDTSSSEVCFELDPECYGVSDDFLRLLTQRVSCNALHLSS